MRQVVTIILNKCDERHRGRQREAKTIEKTEFSELNEYFEIVFNKALATQIAR